MKFLNNKKNSNTSHHFIFQLISISSFFLFLLLSQSVVQSGNVNFDDDDDDDDNDVSEKQQRLDGPRSFEEIDQDENDSDEFQNAQNKLSIGGRSWWSFKVDQDSGLNFHSLITKRGFRLIEYSVDTDDGYQLALHRVVPLVGYSETNYTVGRKPILLAHDLVGSSANWFVNSPDLLPKEMSENGTTNETDSGGGGAATTASSADEDGSNGTDPVCGDNLGFCLILSGKWDVWALNFRGNAYSRRSKNYSTWNPLFWAFSQDQFGSFDIPANIRYIQEITGQKKVAFVGHEVSAAAMLGLLSEHTEFTPETLDPIVLMAPSVYIANAKSLLHWLGQPYGAIALAAFPHEFQLQKLMRLLGLSVCKGEAEALSSGCKTAIEKIYGKTDHFNATRFATITQFWPTSTSADVIAHLAQHYLSNEFMHYKKVFGSNSGDPKAGQPYPLEQIHPEMRILVVTGPTDAFVDPKDAHRLIGRLHLALPNLVSYEVQNETWNHMDFVFGEDAGPLVYDPVIYYLENGDLGPYTPAGNSSRGELMVTTTEAATNLIGLSTAGGGDSWIWG